MRTMDSMKTIKVIHKCLSHWFIVPDDKSSASIIGYLPPEKHSSSIFHFKQPTLRARNLALRVGIKSPDESHAPKSWKIHPENNIILRYSIKNSAWTAFLWIQWTQSLTHIGLMNRQAHNAHHCTSHPVMITLCQHLPAWFAIGMKSKQNEWEAWVQLLITCMQLIWRINGNCIHMSNRASMINAINKPCLHMSTLINNDNTKDFNLI